MIDLRRDGDVFVLHLDEGENRFNASTVGAIHAALDEVDATPGPGALVVTGSGKFFSNGLDLDWMGTPEAQEHPGFFPDLHRMMGRVLGLGMVTVAAVNGHAFAAGAMFSAAFDVKVMREDRGYWCLPEVDLGMRLTPGMNAVITARLPPATAHEAIVTGRRYDAASAVAAGIVDETAPEREVLPRSIEIAEGLAAKRSDILATLKHDLHGTAIDVLLAGGS
jgi:enoyl-CoA hydratase/carnithine racemase